MAAAAAAGVISDLGSRGPIPRAAAESSRTAATLPLLTHRHRRRRILAHCLSIAESLAHLNVSNIERSAIASIPVIHTIRMVASDIVLHGVVLPAGDTGVVVSASFPGVDLIMGWIYSYSSWIDTISHSSRRLLQEAWDVIQEQATSILRG
ncbi:hypothetical protein BRADI_2g38183v3 [Brachypodium distachyon]|uniref:Uncharacterized protein n=1 Tax=Brachypodium distachyon TaxID=15368 RepID=A0A2K2DCJ9_BRADI|nr:hypothetical protein BRADI_2g38183v3 [Brachypodium distachyon]